MAADMIYVELYVGMKVRWGGCYGEIIEIRPPHALCEIKVSHIYGSVVSWSEALLHPWTMELLRHEGKWVPIKWSDHHSAFEVQEIEDQDLPV
jgi:hypothetical protein